MHNAADNDAESIVPTLMLTMQLFLGANGKPYSAEEEDAFFSPAQRSLFVYELLRRTHYGRKESQVCN